MSANFDNFTIGAEIEFYLLNREGEVVADMESGKFPTKRYEILAEYADVVAATKADLAENFNLQDESGAGQFETNFEPTSNPQELAGKILEFKKAAKDAAHKHGMMAEFAAKPVANQPGNALHIHYCNDVFDPLGLQANDGVVDVKVAKNNDYVLWAIGGLLAAAPDARELFFDRKADMARFQPWFNAPTKLCWGKNNRSAAIRVPDSKPKRIEHRIACADVNPLPLIEHIIAATLEGMENEIEPSEQVWGNAWDDKYEYSPIFD